MVANAVGTFTLSDNRPDQLTDVFYWYDGQLTNVEYDKKVDTYLLTYGGKLYMRTMTELVFDEREQA